jgi:hypothetical protein
VVAEAGVESGEQVRVPVCILSVSQDDRFLCDGSAVNDGLGEFGGLFFGDDFHGGGECDKGLVLGGGEAADRVREDALESSELGDEA